MDKKIYMSIIAALATVGAVWIVALLAAPFAKPLAWALIILIAQNATDWYSESEQLVMAITKSAPDSLSNFPLGSKIIKMGDKLGIDFAGYAAKFASSATQFLLNAATNTAKNLAE